MIIISVSCEGSAQFIDNGPAQTIVPIVTDGSSIKTARADDLDGLALIAVSIANAKIYGSAFDDSIYLYGGGST